MAIIMVASMSRPPIQACGHTVMRASLYVRTRPPALADIGFLSLRRGDPKVPDCSTATKERELGLDRRETNAIESAVADRGF